MALAEELLQTKPSALRRCLGMAWVAAVCIWSTPPVVDFLRCRIDEVEFALRYAHVRRIGQASVWIGLEVSGGINGATQELLERVRTEVIGAVHRVPPVHTVRSQAGSYPALLERAVSLLDVGVGSRRCPGVTSSAPRPRAVSTIIAAVSSVTDSLLTSDQAGDPDSGHAWLTGTD